MKRKFLPILMLPVLALTTACGEVKATPNNYETDPLVSIIGAEKQPEIHNNLSKIIYDAKLEGGTVAKLVLDEVLFTLSNTVFGSYAELKEAAAKDDVTDYVAKHKVYEVLNDKGEHDKAREKELVKNQWTRIEERIANKFFDAIKGSFTRDGYFYEEDYAMSLLAGLNKVTVKTQTNGGVLILPEFEGKDVFTAEVVAKDGSKTKLLHIENYNDGADSYYQKTIVPEVYRELLVEQYLFESNYSAIARSYAREVNIITITNRADDKLAANKLMNAYVDNYINGKEFYKDADLAIIDTAWKGYGLDGVTAKGNGTLEEKALFLLQKAGLEEKSYVNADSFVEGADIKYYEGTSYGSLVKKLEKVHVDPKATDSSIESEFTNNGEYTVAKGFEAKKLKIQQEDYITDGWHIRNGGLSTLNEKIRTRLFNIGVANALDNEFNDRFDVNGVYNNDVEANPYVTKVHGKYYLKPATTERPDDEQTLLRDMLWYDDASDSFTIVEITNAVSSSKLSKDGKDNYENRVEDKFEGFKNMQTISHEVAYELAKGESYRTLSTKHWLEAAAIKYHDQSIYEYFETNYPELFKDNK